MPQHHKGGRSQQARTISEAMRGVIVGLRLIARYEFSAIEASTGVLESTACRIYQRAERDSFPATNCLLTLLLNVKDKPKPGRPPKIARGSAESATVRDRILEYGNLSMEDAARLVLREIGQPHLTRSMIENIGYHHHDPLHPFEIVRGKQPRKPYLTQANKEDRVRHCD